MDSKQKDLIKDMWEVKNIILLNEMISTITIYIFLQGFNNQFATLLKNNRQYIIEDQSIRERLIAEVKKAIVPKYTKFYDFYITLPFSSKKGKYIKHTVTQIDSMIGQFFIGDATL